MISRYALFATVIAFVAALPLRAQLNILAQFDPVNTGGLCGIAYNSVAGEVLVYGCSAALIDRYGEDGAFLSSSTMVGGQANDVDIDMSPADLTLNGTFVAQGQLLLVNGESGAAEIYAIDEGTNLVIDTLVAGFGDSHVVGGSYHPQRGTFFLVQDNVPGGFEENRVAEIDATTGDTLYTFSVQPHFDVNYGDLDISPVSGNLFIVSSSDDGIAEFTADGVFITEHLLPVGVSNLSGIALDNDLQGAWVCNTSGTVFKLGNFPVGMPEPNDNYANALLFPNPARERAQLTLEVTEASSYRILLRDMAGRAVRGLFQGTLPMGRRTIDLDLSLIGPGLYTVMVESATRTSARKLMVTR